MNFTNIVSTLLYGFKNLFEFFSESHSTSSSPSPSSSPFKVRYDGAQVWRAVLRSTDDIETIESLKHDGHISIWKLTREYADFHVLRQDKKILRSTMKDYDLKYSVLIPDLQKTIDETAIIETPWATKFLRLGHKLDFTYWPSLEIIDEYYSYLANNFPDLVNFVTIGKSAEGRNITMLKISKGGANKTRVLLIGGQHAREWIAITTVLYIVNEIVTKFDSQPENVQNFEWFIIPSVNPDGYQYTRTHDRLWRKNRRMIGKCRGVDLNRNFGKAFAGSSNTLCDFEVYSGPHAFSEPESVAVKNAFRSMGANIPVLAVDVHNYGQLLIYPWSYDSSQTAHFRKLQEAVILMKKAIMATSGRNYRYGTASQTLQYLAPGTALDWFHSQGTILSIVIEMRDEGRNGFLMPTEEIEAAGKECWEAVKAVANIL